MAQIGWLDDNGKAVTFADALAISEAQGSWADVPHEVLVLIHEQVTKERPDGITVTQLLGCPRKVYLEKTNDWFSHPIENWPSLRGSLVHSLLEQTGGQRAEVEVRYEKEHRGVTVSGQPDSVRVIGKGKKRLLRDWKSTGKLPYYDSAYESHRQQTNIYRWLMDLDPRFTEIEVVYISMEGVKSIPLKQGGTNKWGKVLPSQVWTDEQVEAFLDERLMVLDAQNKAGRPVSYSNVDEKDLWQCPFCPVRAICYKLAGQEAKAAFEAGESVNRVPPRERSKKK
jgi:CRISPR/Cas system-associated exonuclease Cas4 (RecB family)